jgi:uncharacterized membrane protein
MKLKSTRALTVCAMIAALYTAVCLALPFIGYGIVQFRVSEALTLLPVFSPIAIWGVTLGCLLSNLIGAFTGMNPLGLIDAVFGTAATLIAAFMTRALRNYRIRGIPVLAAVPPVIVNAIIIGAELTVLETGSFIPEVFFMIAASVGLGQLVACFGIGLPLVWMLEKTGVAKRAFGQAEPAPTSGKCG